MSWPQTAKRRVSRRAVLRTSAAAATVSLVGATTSSVFAENGDEEARSTARVRDAHRIEPNAGSWRPWLLSSGSQYRLPKPPRRSDTRKEVEALIDLADARDEAALDLIAYWDAGAPGYRWNEIASGPALLDYGDRVLALLNVAIYDATVAAWDSKYAHNRQRPSEFGHANLSRKLTTAIATPNSPSYPCEHATAAGAAAAVLGYLYPDDAAHYDDLAQQAALSRQLAGVAHASDSAAGLQLGRDVARHVIEWARNDNSDAVWDGVVPEGPGLWTGEPFAPLMGEWATWALASGAELRPGPPPAHDSAERAAEIAEVRDYPRDAHLGSELGFWPDDPAGRPVPDSGPHSSNQAVYYYAPLVHLTWLQQLNRKLAEYRLDLNPPRAARAYALVAIAGYDATVASWEAKFHYWTARPSQFDPTITTVLPNYPIPDYPSGHAATMAGAEGMLAYLFPREAAYFHSRAAENAASRLWAGIHFRSACDVGTELGLAVAARVAEHARQDGADSTA